MTVKHRRWSRPLQLRGSRALVMGLGTHGGGVASARFLAEQGARVTITDLAPAAELEESLRELDDVLIEKLVLGGHRPDDFRHTDVLVVSPAVRPDHPLVELAASRGALVTSELELLLERCPAEVVGVTGSNGKSTTAYLLASILAAAGRRTWLGGNCEFSLLPHANKLLAADIVVLELSSFQLLQLSPSGPWPQVAVVTSCTPNHLDWHRNLAEYLAAKRRLVAQVEAEGAVVLPGRTSPLASWEGSAVCRVWWAEDALETVPPLSPSLPGEHNRWNAALAATAATALGCEPAAIATGLRSATGLDHRLELVAVDRGVSYINDSAATTAESVAAAITCCGSSTWLLTGGRSKGTQLEPLAAGIAAGCRGVYCYGEVGEELAEAVRRAAAAFHPPHGLTFDIGWGSCLESGLRWASQRAEKGAALLLSPGFSSRDQYRDYRARGESFRASVRDLVRRQCVI